jgi:hypothetical protein
MKGVRLPLVGTALGGLLRSAPAAILVAALLVAAALVFASPASAMVPEGREPRLIHPRGPLHREPVPAECIIHRVPGPAKGRKRFRVVPAMERPGHVERAPVACRPGPGDIFILPAPDGKAPGGGEVIRRPIDDEVRIMASR